MQENNKNFIYQVIKGGVFALIVTLLSVLVFAAILNFTNIRQEVIKPINCFIRLISVFGGCMFAVIGERGYLKGLLLGGFSTLFSIIIFAILGGGFTFGFSMIVDLVCGMAMGALSGAICVNVRRTR